MPEIDTPIDVAAAAPVAPVAADANKVVLTLDVDAATLKAKIAGIRASAEADLMAGVATLRAEYDSPHGHMIFGVILFVLGLASGVGLSHLH